MALFGDPSEPERGPEPQPRPEPAPDSEPGPQPRPEPRPEPGPGPEPEPELVVAASGDVRRLDALLDQFELAVGQGVAIRRVATAIAQAGGVATFLDVVTAQGDPDRPWKWLAAVAERAAVEGELALVGRTYLFVHFWTGTVAPLLGPDDRMRLGLVDPAPATGTRLAVAAFEALRRLPGREVLVDHPSGVITVATVTICAALRIVAVNGMPAGAEGLPAGAEGMPAGAEGLPASTVVADARRWLDAFRGRRS